MKMRFFDKPSGASFDFSNQLGGVAMKLSAYVVGIVLLCYAVVSLLTIKAAYDSAVRQTYKEIETSMGWALDRIDSRLSKVENVTDAMAKNGERFCDTQEDMRMYMTEVVNSCEEISAVTIEFLPGIVPGKPREYAPTVYVQKSTGDTLFIDAVEKGLHYVDRKYKDNNWLDGMEGKSVWSTPYRSVSDRILRVSYSAPLYDSVGKVFAVLCSTVTLDFLRHVFDETRLDEGCELSVITSRGDYIYKQDSLLNLSENALNDAVKKGNPEVVDITRSMMKGERGTKVFGHEGERYCYYAPIERTNWSSCYLYPTELIKEKPKRLAKKMLIDGLWMMLLTFVALSLGIYYIIRPFTDNLKTVTESNAAMDRDLQIAGSLQQTMLPKNDRSVGYDQIDIFGMLRPAKKVGGDLYDYFFKNGLLYFVIGDVSGKGVPASMYMAIVRILIRVISNTETEVDRIISELNRNVSRSENCMFCTLFLGAMDLATGKVSCCNAGHNRPVLVRTGAEGRNAEYLAFGHGAAVGVFDDEVYTKAEFCLNAGDELFLYTDGVTEAENMTHQLFGDEQALQTILSLSSQEDVKTIVAGMLETVDRHTGKAEQSDDITMLLLKYAPKQTLTLVNDVSETSRLSDWVNIMCRRYGVPEERLFNIQIAIEEAVVNVINYAYPGQQDMPVYLRAERVGEEVLFFVEDEGVPFDPTKIASPDLERPTEDCEIGGLGVFLYSELMDKVEYKYANGRNILMLRSAEPNERLTVIG